MKNYLVNKLNRFRLKMMHRTAKKFGFSVVRLVNRGGTDYIIGANGQFYKIGGKK